MRDDFSSVIYSPTLSYGDAPSFVGIDSINAGGFSSIYAVSAETARFITAAGTSAGFKGVVWSERLWLDFDSYEAGQRAEVKLKELQYDFVVYDTGGRGLHLGILRNHLPSHTLPYQDKEWVRGTFTDADLSIYTHLHLFRLPGTVHQSTGRTKTLLSQHPGKVLTLPQWRPSDRRSNDVLDSDVNTLSGSVFDSRRVMASTIPTKVGERHPTFLKLAYALKAEGVGVNPALWWLSETNKLAEEPKSQEELQLIVMKVYESKETF